MCDQQNVRAFAEDNRGQNTDKGHTPNPRTEIKIPDPAGNQTRAARQGLYRPRHGDGLAISFSLLNLFYMLITFTILKATGLKFLAVGVNPNVYSFRICFTTFSYLQT